MRCSICFSSSGEGGIAVKIVVKTLLDGRPDRYLHIRPKLLNGLRHQVSRAVPVYLFALFAAESMQHQSGIMIYNSIQVNQFAIQFSADGCLCQTRLILWLPHKRYRLVR
jgi:hypothetical protein